MPLAGVRVDPRSAVAVELRARVRDRLGLVYSSDMCTGIPAVGKDTYADASVACDDVRFEDGRRDTLRNPIVVVEVLSPSTEAYDRGKTFEHYRRVESLARYLLVALDEPRVDHYARTPEGLWTLPDVAGLDGVVRLASLEIELSLREIVLKIDGVG